MNTNIQIDLNTKSFSKIFTLFLSLSFITVSYFLIRHFYNLPANNFTPLAKNQIGSGISNGASKNSFNLVESGTTPAPPNSADVTLSLDISTTSAKPVNSAVYGFQLASYYDRSVYNKKNKAQYNGNSYKPDAFIEKTMNDIAPISLRFPGGAMSMYYHYKNRDGSIAVGYGYREDEINYDKSLTKEQYGPVNHFPASQGSISDYTANYMPTLPAHHNFIIDFAALAKKQNSEVAFVVNTFQSGMPNAQPQIELTKEMVEAVKYLVDQGVNLKHIELGCETYHKNLGVSNKVEDYIARAKIYADAIHQVYPKIKLALVAEKPYQIPNDPDGNDWLAWNNAINKAVNSSSGLFSSVIVHVYNPILCDAHTITDLNSLYDCARDKVYNLTNANTMVEADNNLRSIYGKPIPSNIKNLRTFTLPEQLNMLHNEFGSTPIIITEWSLSEFAGANAGNNDINQAYFSNTMIHGMYLFDAFQCFNKFNKTNNNQLAFATMHNFIGSNTWAIINEKGNKETFNDPANTNSFYNRRIPYFALMAVKPIYANHLSLLDLNSNGMKFSPNTDQQLNETTITPYQDSLKNYYIYISNKSSKKIALSKIIIDGKSISLNQPADIYFIAGSGAIPLSSSHGMTKFDETGKGNQGTITETSNRVNNLSDIVIPAASFGYIKFKKNL